MSRTDFLSQKSRSKLMSRIKSSANKTTELRTIKLLRKAGLTGWRRRLGLIGNPDFVWKEKRIALFIDGCFWHGCMKHGHFPHSRREYWVPKLTRNKLRDRKNNRILRQLGWRVLRIWEHELSKKNHSRIIRRIEKALA